MSVENKNSPGEPPHEIPPMTDEEGRRIEIWPGFECGVCGSDDEIVRWEESSYKTETEAPTGQYYSGRESCCQKCGSRIRPELVDRYQPEAWKQPIFRVISGVSGMRISNPSVAALCNVYEEDPEAFLSAPAAELKTIEGIGETLADRIHTRRATTFPDRTPSVDGSLYDFRGRRIRDMDPNRIARDLCIGFVEVDDLTVSDDEPEAKSVLRQTAEILRENRHLTFWAGDKTSEEMVDMADQLV